MKTKKRQKVIREASLLYHSFVAVGPWWRKTRVVKVRKGRKKIVDAGPLFQTFVCTRSGKRIEVVVAPARAHLSCR